MARTGTRERIDCASCGLPFYADEGSCPYCRAGDVVDELGTPDESGFVFDTVEPSDDARTVCPECNLLHYEDADGCPYCAFAGSESGSASSESGSTSSDGSADETAGAGEDTGRGESRRSSTDRDGGLVGRLRRALGL